MSAQLYISCDAPGGAPTGAWTTGTACTGSTGSTGNILSVRVALTYQPITPFVGQIIGTRTIFGSASMVIN